MCRPLLPQTRGRYRIYPGGCREAGSKSPDASLEDLRWQQSHFLNVGIFVSSCPKVLIFNLTGEISLRLLRANLFQALQHDLLPSAS